MASYNIRIDDALKHDMENVCDELGITMAAAFTIFAKKVVRERRIPFELTLDPFYSQTNMDHLRRGIKALNAGHGEAHELIEDE